MTDPSAGASTRFLKLLIFMMFAMFAMTTDSVGTVIPEVIREFRLGMTAAGSFHYASMSGIGIAAILLGLLADRIGRKATILLGLVLFCATSAFSRWATRSASSCCCCSSPASGSGYSRPVRWR
jgi:fucose permease